MGRMGKRSTKEQKTFLARAKKLGYVPFEHMRRELLKDKETRTLYEAGALERAVRFAIIRKRIEKKLTQAQIAKRANMQQAAIARFETGESSPTLKTASRILAAVGAKVHVS